jgi:hypothetical protein
MLLAVTLLMAASTFTLPTPFPTANPEFDALIAAVARSRDDILVTNNIKDFINIPNLKLDNWLEN